MRAWHRAGAVRSVLSLLLLLTLTGQAGLATVPPRRPSWPPTATSRAVNTSFQQMLSRAVDLERSARWTDALRVYQDGLDRWPTVSAFKDGARRCRAHLELARRYEDTSFRRTVSTLPREQAFRLFSEVLRKIHSYYVDPVSYAVLIRRGTDNLQTALTDPVFLRTNLSGATAAQIAELRARLTDLNRLPIRHRAEAEAVVQRAADLAARTVRARAAPVVLEYVVGACDALDVHTSYLTGDALKDLYAQIDGNFVGIGVEVQADAQGLAVLGVVPGSPAAEKGMRVGDHITAVDGASLRGLSTEAAAGRLKGPHGTFVRIVVAPIAGGPERTLALRRREIVVNSVSQSRMLDPARGIAYIQLSGFQKSTATELDAALWRLHRKGMRSLILDLRGNPGGLLTSAVDVSNRFVDRGTVVSTRGRAAGQSWTYPAGEPARTWRMPMVLLIDGDSASASEIVAACLADHRRAVIVGQTSYGKGEVQSIYPLTTIRAGLRLTTARFYSPQGRPLSKRGVTPQVIVANRGYRGGPFTLQLANDPQLREALRVARERLGRS